MKKNILIITVLSFLFFLSGTKATDDALLYESSKTVNEISLRTDNSTDQSIKQPLSIETIDLYADPITPNDTVVMLRMSFQNADILDFIPASPLAVPACENQEYILDNKLCADIAFTETIKKDEPLGQIVVRWKNDSGTASILFDKTNGYYNGKETNYVSGVFGAYSINNSSTQSQLSNSPLLTVFFVLGIVMIIGGIIILLKRTPQKTII